MNYRRSGGQARGPSVSKNARPWHVDDARRNHRCNDQDCSAALFYEGVRIDLLVCDKCEVEMFLTRYVALPGLI